MDSPLRRYSILRKLKSRRSDDQRQSLGLGLRKDHNEIHESGKTSPFSKSRKSSVFRTDVEIGLNGSEIRALSYSSTSAGKPPIVGGKPLKGNGPVKLQTSRRLSSGELLITRQDNERTLADIREGGYIVGRKEPARNSRPVPLKPPSFQRIGSSSPKFSALDSPQILTAHSSASPKPPSPTATAASLPGETPLASPSALERIPSATVDTAHPRIHGEPDLSSFPFPPRTESRITSTSTSIVGRGDEPNAAIHALWKAEHTRLLTLFGQDGVDKHSPKLNHHRRGTTSLDIDRREDQLTNAKPGRIMNHQVSMSLDAGRASPMTKPLRNSFIPVEPAWEDASDHSSHKAISIFSSDGSSSSHTGHNSLFEPEIPTTREDVRRFVEDMRFNYLIAIETTAEEKDRETHGRRPQGSGYPYSLSTGAVLPLPTPLKSTKPHSHARNASAAPRSRKSRVSDKERPVRPVLKTSPSEGSLKIKALIHRADSFTLGNPYISAESSHKQNLHRRAKSMSLAYLAQHPAAVSGLSEVPAPPQISEHSADNGALSPTPWEPSFVPENNDFEMLYRDICKTLDSPSSPIDLVPVTQATPSKHLSGDSASFVPPPLDIGWLNRNEFIGAT